MEEVSKRFQGQDDKLSGESTPGVVVKLKIPELLTGNVIWFTIHEKVPPTVPCLIQNVIEYSITRLH